MTERENGDRADDNERTELVDHAGPGSASTAEPMRATATSAVPIIFFMFISTVI